MRIIKLVFSNLVKVSRLINPFYGTQLIRFFSGYKKKITPLIEKNIHLIRPLIAENNIFIDCGANDGLILSEYAKRLNQFDFAAFEIQQELINKIESSDIKGIEIYQKAVCARSGTVDIYVPKSHGPNFQGKTSIMSSKIAEHDLLEKRQVEGLNFVRFLKERRSHFGLIVVKMDIEGAEYEIINALWEEYQVTGLKLIDIIIIEFHPKVLSETNSTEEYMQILENMGILISKWI